MINKRSLEERFWAKVVKTSECWKWTANKNNKGYGMIREGGLLPKRLAHRVSWVIHNGQIPEQMCVLHKCDNPECTNPNHLFLGTLAENMLDKERKGRSGRDENWLIRNRENGKKLRKLSLSKENDVRKFHAAGMSIHLLSRTYAVTRNVIKRIIKEQV
jgi:HNH endonuclease